MPQATDELRSEIEALFGDAIDLHAPLQYLLAKGFKDRAGMLIPPTRDYALTQVEGTCIDFLCDEWDFSYDPALALTNGIRESD
jgi:hypothetical protein